MTRRSGLFLAIFCLACSAAPGATDAARGLDSSASDAGVDAAAESDANLVDANAADADDADAATPADASIDTGADAHAEIDASATDLGLVTCRDDGECVDGATCDRDAPGGRCQGCSGTCALGQECLFGACLAGCTADTDCNAGMRCAAFAEDTYCRPRACGDCPAPYVCRGGECSRPLCGASEPCPAPLLCEAGYCVEP